MIHPSAVVDEGALVADTAQIWHFCHISTGAVIGPGASLGQNVFVGRHVRIGANCKIQNNVSIYEGVELEEDVFCGPSCVFTNIAHPRAFVSRRDAFQRTVLRRGATIGANATIVCGTTIGRFAFVAAGAVVTSQAVPDHALLLGVPARKVGWVGRTGIRLTEEGRHFVCRETGERYQLHSDGLRRVEDDAAER